MLSTAIVYGDIFPGTPANLLGRFRNLAGAYVTQASLASITYGVWDVSEAPVLVTTGTLAIASTIFDALQTGPQWPVDNIGFNFLGSFPATCFPNSGRDYLVEVTMIDQGGVKSRARWGPKTQPLLTSPL